MYIYLTELIGKPNKISVVVIESKMYFLKNRPKVTWDIEYLFENPIN